MKENLISIGIKAKRAFKIKIDNKTKNKVLVKFLQLINKTNQMNLSTRRISETVLDKSKIIVLSPGPGSPKDLSLIHI